MRAISVPSLLFVAASLMADTREVIKTTVGGKRMLEAQYFQGKSFRTETLSEDGATLKATIENFEHKAMYQLDMELREYMEWRAQSPDLILSLARWISRPQRPYESGKTVNIYYETVDTGERREFFGHTARHLFLRERHVAEAGACELTHQIEKNGWYLPRDERTKAKVAYLQVTFDLAGSGTCHDTVLKHGDPSVPGFPVLESCGSLTRQILELSNSPLDKKLFEVPNDFRKVEALPGQQPVSEFRMLGMEWEELRRALESWFN
jgi:hypothetical protein